MTIELKPEQERILQQAIGEGRFHSLEVALAGAIQSIAPSGGASNRVGRSPGRKRLAQLFAESPLKGLDLQTGRVNDGGRPVDL